ncbi:MAG TPA: hypothetical protein VGK99_06235 [Acidobacteriota bacterium]|jgi:indoleamine 2,3-dioxygenase
MSENLDRLKDLRSFDVSPSRGFLSDDRPLVELPSAWKFLDAFGAELPKVLKQRKIKQAAEDLPAPSEEMLASLSPGEQRRAMMIYGFGASGYIHGQGQRVSQLCKPLAQPLYLLSKRIDKPPILSYCSYSLNNWRCVGPQDDITVDNLKLLQNFIPVPDEDWFILIHVDIERRAAPAIVNVCNAVISAAQRSSQTLLSNLTEIGASLQSMIETLKRMPEGCSTEVYFKMVRPWIMFFTDVVYEGVAELENKPQSFRGETGAQSSIMPLLEAGLGIRHDESILTRHLREMRLYMPRKHRLLIEEVERSSKVREVVVSSGSTALRTAYNYCLEKMFEFRDIHLGYAFSYIHQKTENEMGTGGTVFMPWLEQMRNETREQFLV